MVNKPKNLHIRVIGAPASAQLARHESAELAKVVCVAREPHDSAEKEEEEEWEEEEEEEEEEESSEHFPADFVGTPQTARGAERI